MKRKYNIVDLFSGCGGLLDGFLQSNLCKHLASVEWEKAPVDTLRNRLITKWGDNNANETVIQFDIQRTDELLNGFDDDKYGKSKGLKKIIGSIENAMIFEYITDEPVLSKMYIYNANFSI